MKKTILLLAIALVSCKEEINKDCALSRYECKPRMTAGTTVTLSCKSCVTKTLICNSCGNSTITPEM